jgi:hypothetical protein
MLLLTLCWKWPILRRPHQGPATTLAVAMSRLVTSSKPAFLPASSASFQVRISCGGGAQGAGGAAGEQGGGGEAAARGRRAGVRVRPAPRGPCTRDGAPLTGRPLPKLISSMMRTCSLLLGSNALVDTHSYEANSAPGLSTLCTSLNTSSSCGGRAAGGGGGR